MSEADKEFGHEKVSELQEYVSGKASELGDRAEDRAEEAKGKASEVLQNTEQGLQATGDQIGQAAHDGLAYMRDTANSTQQTVEDGINAASGALKSGAVNARIQYNKAYQRSQEFVETGKAHSQAGIDMAFDKFKEGVHICRDYPNTTYAVAGVSAIFLFPGLRHFLWRKTVGRFQSEEALFKSAETRATHLKQNVKFHSDEQQKLMERLAAAQEQYNTGLSKVKATTKQLASLESTVGSTEQKAETLVRDLRELPSSQALKLRAQVAVDLAAVKQQRSALERQVYSLSKKGF